MILDLTYQFSFPKLSWMYQSKMFFTFNTTSPYPSYWQSTWLQPVSLILERVIKARVALSGLWAKAVHLWLFGIYTEASASCSGPPRLPPDLPLFFSAAITLFYFLNVFSIQPRYKSHLFSLFPAVSEISKETPSWRWAFLQLVTSGKPIGLAKMTKWWWGFAVFTNSEIVSGFLWDLKTLKK